jgi:hypothetical protein
VEIWHEGKCVARHERCFSRQQKVLNLEHYLDVLAKKNPPVKHGTHLVTEPFIQIGATTRLADKLNTKSNFGHGYDANVKIVKRLPSNESHNLRFRLRPTQFGQDIGVEQPGHQNSTLRTGRRLPKASMLISLYGEDCIAATRAAPVAGLLVAAGIVRAAAPIGRYLPRAEFHLRFRPRLSYQRR